LAVSAAVAISTLGEVKRPEIQPCGLSNNLKSALNTTPSDAVANLQHFAYF
jgi:hypothetical protein